MELTKIVLVSFFLTVASSTPHGYGVKGGAGAIAKSGAVAGAGAIAFPGGVPDFGGVVSSGSGSFAKSSASSFASASSGSFSYGGNAGFGGSAPDGTVGQQGQNSGSNGGNNIGGGQSGAVAGASAGAFAGALAGSSGQGIGSSGPCSGNCPSSAPTKSSEPSNCQGSTCGQDNEVPKCSGSYCNTGSSPDSRHNQAPDHSGHGSELHRGSLPVGFQPVDAHDRPGKIGPPGPNDGPFPGYGYGASSPQPQNHQSENSLSPNPSAPCNSPHCSNSEPSPSKPCSSSNCAKPTGSAPCTSPYCGSSSLDSGSDASSNAVAGAKAGASAGQYGKSDQVNPSYGRTPILNSNPPHSSGSEKTQYSGSFGGPPGILRPNDYTIPEKPGYSPIHHDTSSYGSTSTGTQLGPHSSLPPPPAIFEQLPNLHSPNHPSTPVSTTSGFVLPAKGQKPSTGYFGKPGSPSFIGSGAFAGAAAGASAGIYSGGFGGPPGILKPNDYSLHGLKPGDSNGPHGIGHISGPHQPPSQSKPDIPGKPSTNFPSTSYDEESYQGGLAGTPGVVRPNGPLGTGTFPSSQPQNKPEGSFPQQNYPGKPGLACAQGSGVGCGNDGSYHGGFGGAPGILRPTGPAESSVTYPSEQTQGKPEGTPGCAPGANCGGNGPYHGIIGGPTGLINQQDQPNTSNVQNNLPDSTVAGCASSGPGCGNDGSYHGGFGGAPGVIRPTVPQQNYPGKPTSSYPSYSSGTPYQIGYGSSPTGSGSNAAGTGAFAGAAAGATAGSIAGYSGPGEYSSQGGYGSHGGYGPTKNSFATKGCGGGCGGDNSKSSVDLGSLTGAAAKSGAASFNFGGVGALDAAEALAGAGALAEAGAGAGAGAGGLGGTFAGAQASATASAKSYGGYH